MADPAENAPPPDSRPASAARPGEPGAGKPFEKGRSGNPGGRPKGLARKVREILGDDDGQTVAMFWAACMSGELVRTGPKGDRVVEKVEMRDRLAASKLLAERGWGKPPQFVPIEDDDPLGFSEHQTSEIAADFDQRVDELEERRRAKEADARGEDAGG